jgi:hypothetical protein
MKIMDNDILKIIQILEDKSEDIARRVTKDVISDVMPRLQSQLEESLQTSMSKIVDAKASHVVLEITGESYDDAVCRRTVRNAVQWAIRSANKSSLIMRTIITVGTSSMIGAAIAIIFKR